MCTISFQFRCDFRIFRCLMAAPLELHKRTVFFSFILNAPKKESYQQVFFIDIYKYPMDVRYCYTILKLDISSIFMGNFFVVYVRVKKLSFVKQQWCRFQKLQIFYFKLEFCISLLKSV